MMLLQGRRLPIALDELLPRLRALPAASSHMCTRLDVHGSVLFAGAKECPPEAICQNCMPIDGKDTCWPVKTPVIYKLESYGKVENADEAGMMSEIYERGPIVCSIATPDDFTYG